MSNWMEWLLSKMQLVDDNTEELEGEPEEYIIDKSWFEIMPWKKEKMPEAVDRIYFKDIHTYEDCRELIDSFQEGCVCIFRLNAMEITDTNEMMNYVCGGIYALAGEIENIGDNVFMLTMR